MSKIIIENVNKVYPNGFQALNNIKVDIQSGSFVVILGPSGAGKSTLLRIINGLETSTSGNVFIDEDKVNPKIHRQIRSRVGMIFQQFNLVSRLSVMMNVLTGRLAHSGIIRSLFYLFRSEDINIAREVLFRVGLIEKAWERADKLSGGQQQRVGIARALAQRPKVILADEPVASLDPVTAEEIMILLREICDRDQITMVVTLHNVDLAKQYADRIIGMNSGHIVFDGKPDQLDQSNLQLIYQNESHDDEKKYATMAYA